MGIARGSRREHSTAPLERIERIEFHRTKYGPEILVDAAWVREMPTFLAHGPHVLTFYEILLVTRGRGHCWLDTHRHVVRRGEVLFTTPGQVRTWQVRGLDGLCFFFPALFLEEFFQDPFFLHHLAYFHVPGDRATLRLSPARMARLRRHLLAMRRELTAPRPDSAHLLRAHLYEALVSLARDYAAAHRLAAESAPNALALRFRELVERDACRCHRAADYARALAVSPGHLNVLCRRHLGRSAKAVIQARLVVEARRRLLYSDAPAAAIAYALGFRDPSYFARFFRRATGAAPTAFRAAGRGRMP